MLYVELTDQRHRKWPKRQGSLRFQSRQKHSPGGDTTCQAGAVRQRRLVQLGCPSPTTAVWAADLQHWHGHVELPSAGTYRFAVVRGDT